MHGERTKGLYQICLWNGKLSGRREETASKTGEDLRLLSISAAQPDTSQSYEKISDCIARGRDGRANAPTKTPGLTWESQQHLVPALGAEYITEMVRRPFNDDSGLRGHICTAAEASQRAAALETHVKASPARRPQPDRMSREKYLSTGIAAEKFFVESGLRAPVLKVILPVRHIALFLNHFLPLKCRPHMA